MNEKRTVKKLIIAGISIIILILGILTQEVFLALGVVIGFLISLINFRLIVRTTIRGIEFDTRKKMRRYYFLTNLLRYSLIVLLIYLIIVTKKISLLGIILGLLLGILFILSGIY